MHKIITISREFGSGGRELGKRLAEELGIPCYDHQIIEMIAKENGFDERYVANVSEKSIEAAYSIFMVVFVPSSRTFICSVIPSIPSSIVISIFIPTRRSPLV